MLSPAEGHSLPGYVQQEFADFLECGRLEHGFLRVRCDSCHHEKLVAFSCKRRDFCPSCGARRMVESAALLVDEVFPVQPLRQWVLTVPFPLRFLFAAYPALMGRVLGIVTRAISTHLVHQSGHTRQDAQTGAVTLIQRFGSALNLNIHFHRLFLDGVYIQDDSGRYGFCRTLPPTVEQLHHLLNQISNRVAPDEPAAEVTRFKKRAPSHRNNRKQIQGKSAEPSDAALANVIPVHHHAARVLRVRIGAGIVGGLVHRIPGAASVTSGSVQGSPLFRARRVMPHHAVVML